MATLKQLKLDTTMPAIETGLQTYSNPTLILWGAVDPWLEIDAVKNLANTNEAITLVELPEAKHYPQEHWASEIATEIVQFFRRKVF